MLHSEEKEQHLIIGCGHKSQCELSHSSSEFVTIDKNKKMQPDIIADIVEDPYKCISAIKKVNHNKFSSLIFEGSYFAFDADNIHFFKPILTDNAHIIFVGYHMLEVLQMLPEQSIVWVGAPKRNVLIVQFKNFLKNDKKDFKYEMKDLKNNLQPKLLRYMGYPDNEYPILTKLEMKKIRPLLSRISKINELKEYKRLLSSDYIIEKLICTDEKIESVTAKDIEDCVLQYTPGFFRKNFSSGGMTTGIKSIKLYISKFEPTHVFDMNELIEILHILNNEKNNINPKSSTSDVFNGITIKILNFIISNQDRMNLFIKSNDTKYQNLLQSS